VLGRPAPGAAGLPTGDRPRARRAQPLLQVCAPAHRPPAERRQRARRGRPRPRPGAPGSRPLRSAEIRNMSQAALVLLGLLSVLALFYVVRWVTIERRNADGASRTPGFIHAVTGFVTNFFDTLGVGSFAPTTSVFKLFKLVPDE